MSLDITSLDIYTIGTRAWFPHEEFGWILGILKDKDLTNGALRMTFRLDNQTVFDL